MNEHPHASSCAHWLRRAGLTVMACSLAASWLLAGPQAEAVQIKKVYSSTVTFDGTDIVQAAPIGAAVDTSKSIILLSNSISSNTRDQNNFFAAQFEDPQTVNIQRGGVSGGVYGGVIWQVVEFADGVNVQRGISSLAAGQLTKIISLPVTLTDSTKAVPIVQVQSPETTTTRTHEFFLIPTFPSSATCLATVGSSSCMKLDRLQSTSTKVLSITWQVIEFLTDATVQTGTVTLPVPGTAATNQTVTATVTALSNAGANALLFFYLNPNTGIGGSDGNFFTRGTITNATTLTFLRGNAPTTASTDVNIQYYVVDFTAGTNALGYGEKGAIIGAHTTTLPATVAISSSTDATPIVITTSAVHGLTTGDLVNIDGHTTNTNANGNWVVTVLSTTTFSLNGSTATGLGAGGAIGNVMPAVQTALTAANMKLSRAATLISGGTVTATSTAYADDLAFAGMLVSPGGAAKLATTRSSLARAINADLNYFAYEFPPLTLKSPNGGEVWKVGEIRNITWKHSADLETGGTCNAGIGPGHKLKIELSRNSGSTYLSTTITSDVCANLDTFAWTIPASMVDGVTPLDLDVATLRVKITDTEAAFSALPDARRADVSNADFEIKGTLTITAPNTNLTWFVGDTTRNITWTKTGNLDDNGSGLTQGKVQLELWTPGGAAFDSAITPGTGSGDPLASALTYAWNPIPDKIGPWRVKIKHLADPTGINDFSDVDFNVKGTITVTYPNGGETLESLKTYAITWTKTGTFPGGNLVNLFYSTDSGGTWTAISSCTGVAAGAASGSCNWTVPSAAIGTNTRIRAQQAGDPTVTDDSNANFTVVASIVVTSPNIGTEVWQVGTTQNITWTINGTGITGLKLEYSTNGFADETQTFVIGGSDVTAIPPSPASYAWTIPNSVGTNIKVRIRNFNIPSVFDVSDFPFTIKSRVHVLVPNGGEVWTVGSSRVIQWENFGTLTGNVKILYSTDGVNFPDPGNLLTSTTLVSALSYTWNPIPDQIGTTVKVRVAPLDVNGASDDSDANFAIKGALTVGAPLGGETWIVGTSHNITWTKTGSIGAVKLLYSTDGGVTFPDPANVIASGLDPVLGTPYAWAIPDNISGLTRVRVQLVSDATVNGTTPANFDIKGSLTLTAPVGAETWIVGETIRSITWTRVGTTGNMTGNIKLEYSTDGGLTYPNLINNTTLASALSYNWNPIPDAIGTNRRMKVTLLSDPAVNSTSSANFTIKGKLTLTAPVGGETWIVGSAQNITWTTNGTIPTVNLYYSTDGGVTYPPSPNIASAISNVGSYSWTIPDAIGSSVRVKVENVADTSVVATSPANFTIKGSLAIVAPNGGETWVVGATQTITWTKTGTLSGNVKLIYSTDGGATYPDPANVITSTTLVTALNYAWTVPDAIGTTLRVKIIYLNDTTVTSASAANFTIKGSLTITAPNGGEVWAAGTTQTIAWTKTGTLGAVKLEYSTDGGVTYPNLITGSVPATPTSYAWAIPAGTPLTTTGRIKITLLSDTTVAAASANNFRVRGNVTLTAPIGGETWIVSNTKNITWTIAGAITNVKLEYSKNAFTDELQTFSITASTPAAGLSYAWVIPDAIGTNLKVRVSDTNDATTNSVSTAPFTIKGSVTITAPNGGETWIVGTTQNIAWTMTGSLGNVKLEYSTDGGTTWPVGNLIIASTTADTPPVGDNAGSYAWLIPDAIGASVKVRVSQATDSTVNSVSALNFTIKGSLAITAPNGSEGWPINSVQTITWTKTGTLTGNLKLEYSTDGGLTYPVANLISNTVLATSTSYAWTVPDNPTTQARVRITYLNDTTVSTVSAANFSIKGSLFITAPNGGEVWVVGQSRNITWTRGGSIANAKLDYSTDGGATYPNSITLSTPAANLSYTWTIPDSISNTVRVRIMDANDSTVNSASAANFTIKGSLTLTAPNGGETWIVSSVQNITWTKTGTIANVKLEYSTDGGLTYPNLIVASTPGANLSYAWTIPDAIGTSLRAKITNLADSTVTASSAANFTIKGSLALTSPVGGETWLVGESRAITWTKQGSIANVKLEYSKNGFLDELQTFVIIASTPTAPLSYTWTVADAIGTALKVRVSDASDATVKSVSAANFTIKGKLALTSPVGGESWVVLSSHNITWTRTGSIVNVKLQYSTDGGSTFPNVIAATTDAAVGTYAWTIPDAIGSLVKVRVNDVTDATVFNDSPANFKIVGALTVTSPVGGEKWTVGSVQTITWTRTGSIANVKFEYSTDSGVTFPAGNLIIATTPATALSYAWTVPNSPSATVRVRISDASDATVNAVSAANFKIKTGLTVTAPNGGEVWTVASPQTITWTTVGTAATVKLEYSTDGGLTYPNLIILSTTNTGSYSWTVPDAISTSARVKVTNTADVDSFGASAANFKIRGVLTVTAPNGAEQWGINTTQNITWTRTGSIVNVKLEYSTDGGTTYPNVITASTPASTGTYAWLIPNAPATTARVRVSDASDATVNAASAANFSIKGSLTLTSPTGGEVWVVSTARNITWTVFGAIANVKLEYSTDGGVTYPVGNLIIASTPASTLSYTWTIPDAIGSTLRVRVSDASDATVNAQSVANFSIKGSITLTSPVGGEVWIVGAAQNITWTKTGSFLNVKLEYSTNGFFDELQTILITASTPSGTPASSGSFAWTIPDAIGTSLKVRASDASNATVVSVSGANFTIKGSLALTSPNGGELWRVGESRNITWTKTGSIATVKLEYSTDGGTTYPNVITASTSATTGTYAWTVPDAIGTTRRVRITNTADATVTAASAANFEIKGQVTVTAPTGGEVWTVGTSRNITWTKQGTFSFVKLEYSTNAFANELQTTVIALSVDAVLGTPYVWTVPDAIGTTLRVRVTNTVDAAVVSVSGANFKIVGALTLTAPVGGESWTVGTSQNITWTKVGSIANVKLEYSTDGGATYPNVIVASTAAGTGAYAWTVPDAIGTTRRVRLSDASDTTVNSTSTANFTVKAGFTVTAPNGGEVWTVGSAQTLTWTTVGTAANVKLEYSTDGGTTYPNVIAASTLNTGSYGWTVADAISTLARIRVSDVANANALDISNANFKIRGALLLTAPNGAEGWPIATVQNVTWARTGSLPNVKLEYSTNGFADELQTTAIIASTPADPLPADNTGTYAWTIPDAPSATVKVRVSDASDATVNDLSNAVFSIKGALTITAPNSGEVWVVGATNNITWTKLGAIANVKLEYSTDGGVTYPVGNLITASTPAAALSYSWTIPDSIASTVRVRITDVGDGTVNDQSDVNFKIRGSLVVTAPNGGETWIVGASQNLTWTKTGSFLNVKLEYSTNGFFDELQTILITASTPSGTPASSGSFAWTVPDAIGTTLKVRASDAADATVSDVSNANFTIKSSLALTSPNGGELWRVGEVRNITWTKTGSIATVKLEYSTDGGTTYPNVITLSTAATTGTYAWTVPDAIGTTRRVRITNTADATVTAASAANFEIKGQVTVTAPNGGEVWVVGTSRNITWTKQGTFSFVKLEYSTNAFANELQTTVIALSVDAVLGTPYAWTVPDAIGTSVRVRATNTADAAVFDVSDANFKIVGSLTLTAPVGGEAWTVGTSQNITWTKVGSIANVKLEYSTDGGLTYPNLIVASTAAGTGAYTWTVPDAIGANRRVRISDASDSTVFAASAANFKILGGFTLTAPTGGEVWVVGASQNITWATSGTVANVKLEYSTDGGGTFPNVIVASTANTGTYAWTIPDAISTTVKVRISDVLDATAFKVSAANFKIRGSLALTAPNGGEAWPISSSRNITWTKTGSIATVKLEYSLDSGVTYPNLITASTVASTLSYAWTIPNAPSTTVRVRITDVSDATVVATSAGNFKIQGVLTLTAPIGGEAWIVGSSYNITWTMFGAITNVKLQYSTDGGVTWPDPGKVITALTAAAPLSYTWTIPDDVSSTVKVRISDTGDPSVLATSAANFSIKGSLTVTAPVGGETWVVASTNNITWTKTGTIPNVKLEYSKNGFADELQTFLITASVLSTPASYAWTIPDAISATVKVRVSNVTDATVKGVSAANFAIKGSVTVNAPNGGEVWVVGSSQPITWSKVGSIANVKIDYSTDGGVSFPNPIVASVAASAGSYSWTIPDAITTTARVRVADASDATVFAVSAANFKIAGSLTLTAPNGAEAWLIGSTQNITWTKTGSIANVKLEYSTDGGVTYPNLIVASVSATLGTPYAWVIPDAPSTTARVKITNTADATVFKSSAANFNIRGSVTLTSPVGSEVWVVGSAHNITWTRTGSFANVKLDYSTDGGATYPNVITASTVASALSYAWTVPDAISTTVRVKITQTDDSAVTSASPANFKIKGSVNLTAPNGSEVWIVGATQNITWTRTGSFANVKLEYSTNGFFDELQTVLISASAPAAPLSYAWTVPDAIGSSVKVRISDAADSTVTAVSAANFTIKGSLTVNAPNGGETWVVGSVRNITWAKTGTIANVKLEYSTDGGLTYPNVITLSTPAASLSYAWTIPDTISSTVKVKMTNLADATVTAASAANFSIKGSLTLTAPIGGEVWVVGATQNITWTKTGSIATAKLEYSTDGGVTYPNVITLSVAASALTFAWTIPDNMSSTVKVKITNTADATVSSASAANFKIAGSFTLTSPVGGEKWAAGSLHSITWTKTGSILNAKLEYSTDGGLTYPNLIVATTLASNLNYAWTLGSTTSTQVRVRITDVSDSTVFSASPANFKIMGGFTLTAPNGGEVWVVGTSQNITWTTVGNVANVKLSYSIDGGTTYPNVIAATTANTGSYAWTIPDAIGTTLRVKVEDVLDVDAFATSAANFKIKGSLTVTAPNGGEIWTVVSSRSITWTKTGSIANIKIEYSTDGGLTYPVGNLIAASVVASLGTYAWTVPDAISTTVKVRLTDVTDATVTGVSSANFTIRGSFTLTAPNGGEKWKVGTTQPITWTTFGTIPNVKLEYSTDGGVTYPNVIVASVANTGTYNWSIPNAITTTARIRLSNAADPGTLAISAANFKIMAGFTVTAPTGGEVWIVGSSQNITWTTAGTVSNVKLEYSTDGGVTYPVGNLISASTPNTGTFAWTVPNAISTTLRVRVLDVTDTVDAFATSAVNFKIRAGFTLTAPSGGQAWTVGTTQNITWTTSGTVANVKLEYSTDSGTTYPNVIAASTANTGTYAWVIPDAITTAARVRVSDVNDITANATSGTNFKIQGSLLITAPNGGEQWTVGSVRTVTWNRAGSIGFVKLEFSTNGGALYAPITASTSNTGSYAWTIPDNISTTCLVRVSDVNDATVNSVSAAVFKIQAGFTVTSPAGGEVWAVGSARTITWTTNGTVAFVKIDYSTDGGVTFPNLITSSTANLGTYAWTVPDNVSGTVRVRVSQTTDAAAFGTSAGNFRIRATFVMVSPNGAEQWRVGQVQNITWAVTGTIPNVQLQYSRDGFTVDVQTISASAPNTGTYAWTIPDAISNTVKVRVSDPNDIGAFAASGANFRITGNFTVTAPNGGEQWIVGTTQNITWTKTGTVANAKIEYSTDAGGTWLSIAGLAPNNGLFVWIVPDTITALGRIRLSDPNDATANAISAANFKIKAGFTLVAPNGGQVWTVGQSQSITWTNTGTVPAVKLEYSTNSGVSYPNLIVASTANTGTYAWTVPDAISTGVRVKVSSTTDADAFATSAADFKIRGAFTMTAPNGGEAWKIAQVFNITWTTTGTIPNVKLSYSTDGGLTYPNLITASVVNANSYSWTIPDAPTTTARVRLESTADSTVFATSAANFSLQGNFTITSPNGGEVWTVNEIRNVTWSWGGTIPNVKLTYSTDGGVTYPNIIALSAPNGAGSSGSFSYAWTVPNSISTTVRVKIENVTDAATFDTSDANFKIQGKLVLATPNGGERWVVNETRAITWTTTGTIPTVKLEYSTDSGLTYPAGNVITASVANTGTYNWVIPNNVSTTARVRVSNTADATVSSQSAANFKIDLYQITFQVRDLLTNNNLDQLSVNATNTSFAGFTWAQSGMTSPIVKTLAFGNWQTTFTRVSYGDQTVNFVAGSDQTVQVFMETQVVHLWEAVTELAYNTSTDTLNIASTLRRDGSTVPGAVSCTVKFYDAGFLIKTFTNSGAPDAQGFYGFVWSAPTGLVAGKVYNIVTTISIATGGVFNTPRTFSITTEKKLQDVQDTVNQKLDIPLSQVNAQVQTTLNNQTATLSSKMDQQTGLIQTTLNNFTSQVARSITSLEDAASRSQIATTNLENAASKSQAAAKELEKVGKKYSARLLLPPSALVGDTVTLRYRAGEHLQPLIDIFVLDKEGNSVTIVKAEPMKESLSKPGLYEYTIKVDTANKFLPGRPFTVFIQEPATGNLEAGSVFVESTSLSSLEGLVASNSGAKNIAQETLDAVNAVRGTLSDGGNVGNALELLKTKVDRLPRLIAEDGGTVQMKKTVSQVAETIKTLAGEEGFDFSQLVKKGIEESPSLKQVREKTDEVQGATEVMQILMEQKLGGVDDPVVHVTYQ